MKLLHPLTKLVLIFSAAAAAMFTRSLTAACISSSAALLTLALCKGAKKALDSAGLLALFTLFMAVTNPLFVHEGATPLLFVGGRVYALEALLYGATSGLTLGAAVIWLSLLNTILPKQEQLYLFGRLSPKLGLMLSMTLGLIPRMRRKLSALHDAQLTSGIFGKNSFRSSLRLYSALAERSAETAADTAQTMNARCYGKSRMTCSLTKRVRMRDIILIALTLTLTAAALMTYRQGGGFNWYPQITAGSCEGAFAAVFGVLSALPAIILTKEKLKWRLYTARSSASPTGTAKPERSKM